MFDRIRSGLTWNGVMMVALLIGLWGCGVKGPPVPPTRPPLQPVRALSGTLSGDTVTLTWQHDQNAQGIDHYVVLRSQTDPAQPPCPGCPLVLQRVGTAGFDRTTQAVVFAEQVPNGFIYTYKVRPVGSAGDQGPDAKEAVVIDRSVP